LEKIKHFVSKGAMDIDGVGEKLCQTLFEKGLVQDSGDFYFLSHRQLLGMDRMGEKSAAKVLASIEASKNRPFQQVVFALGIPNIGEETASILTNRYSSIEALSQANAGDLMSIPSIGPKITEGILAFFRQPQNLQIIDKLKRSGVQMESAATASKDLPLSGQEFVLTGRLETAGRQEMEARVRSLGGKAALDVTRKTNYLVVGADPGSKLARAQALDTRIISEREFIEILNTADAGLLKPQQTSMP
jgi:DNA ligase (NAD+)